MHDALLADLRQQYTIYSTHPVNGGWMNRKWKIHTDQGIFLVKQFSHQRFTPRKLKDIEDAMQRQILLHQHGIPCPAIELHGDRVLRRIGNEITYMVMTFHSGHMETPESITMRQLHSLGETLGHLHAAFSTIPLQGVKNYPSSPSTLLHNLRQHCEAQQRQASSADEPQFHDALHLIQSIASTLAPSSFAHLPRGIGHEDFSPDNMLLNKDGVDVILDFDRSEYGFLWHDVGRAILSFCLQDDQLNMARIIAFQQGYNHHMPLSVRNIADALRVTWCWEVPWWIQPRIFQPIKDKVARFRDEILWVTHHWDGLDEIFSS